MIKKLTFVIILSSGLIACSQNFYNEKLMEAIANNDIKQVSSILKKQKANINYISESKDEYKGMMPLTLASYKGNYEIVKLLVENGADINAKDNVYKVIPKFFDEEEDNPIYNGKTALTIALEKGNIEMAKYLIENGADISAKDNDGKTALMIASKSDNIENDNIENDNIENHNIEMVKYLVEKGADINAKDNNGRTSLMHASSNGDLEVVKYLVENGADINAKDYGMPLDEWDKWLLKSLGRELPKDINLNIGGETALTIALEKGNIEMAKYLIESGADINAKDNDGKTALMKVTHHYYGAKFWNGDGKECVDFLIKNKANVNAKDNYGWTALMYACSLTVDPAINEKRAGIYGAVHMPDYAVDPDILDIVKLLIKAGANVNEVNNYGDSALLYAISTYKKSISKYRSMEDSIFRRFELIDYALPTFETIKLLIDNGANVNIKDKDGETPLSLAAGFPELIELLKDNGAHY